VPAWVGGSWAHLVTEQSTSASEKSPYLAFIVATHCATAIALLIFYARAWARIVGGLLRSIKVRAIENATQRLGWLIVVATIPVGILGLTLEHSLRTLFAKPLAAAIFLTINGLILLAAEQLLRNRPVPAEVKAAAESEDADRGQLPGGGGVLQPGERRGERELPAVVEGMRGDLRQRDRRLQRRFGRGADQQLVGVELAGEMRVRRTRVTGFHLGLPAVPVDRVVGGVVRQRHPVGERVEVVVDLHRPGCLMLEHVFDTSDAD
ncbi:MAG TPA: undecaprenyl-diphosphate phosphatase, partial [Mycobacteriales bacterium]|nr:undecaprenyl-diphosphate phosphatase [Mycobacteriales bacterium]